jgi:hypothetical protein
MTGTSRFLLRVARWIGGSARAEWVDAMEAEAGSMMGNSASWAVGCVWASMKDRFARDWWFVAAILLLPACALYLKATVFFWTSELLVHSRISPLLAVATWVLSYFPLPFLLAQWRPGRPAYVATVIGFLVVELFPIVLMWVKFGVSPLIWLGPNSNWYKADPNVRIGPAPGLALDLFVWLSAAWLGSTLRRLASR